MYATHASVHAVPVCKLPAESTPLMTAAPIACVPSRLAAGYTAPLCRGLQLFSAQNSERLHSPQLLACSELKSTMDSRHRGCSEQPWLSIYPAVSAIVSHPSSSIVHSALMLFVCAPETAGETAGQASHPQDDAIMLLLFTCPRVGNNLIRQSSYSICSEAV
jgi:hypothetical protein